MTHASPGAGPHPVVWAVVLIYGGEDVTAACLDSLLASDYPALRILLADNASPDGAGERLRHRYPGVAYLNTGANLGYAGGNNRGVAWVLERGADYVLVINNDTVVERDCVTRLVRTAQADAGPALGLVAPKILYFDRPDRIWFGGGRLSRTRAMGLHLREMDVDDRTEADHALPITFATGCCFLMPAGVARREPLFDERFFMYCEDVELSLRLGEAGYRLLYQPAARLLHRHAPGKLESTPFEIRQRDRNRRRIVTKHYGFAARLKFLLFFYPSRAVRLVQHLGRREWGHARAIIDGAVR